MYIRVRICAGGGSSLRLPLYSCLDHPYDIETLDIHVGKRTKRDNSYRKYKKKYANL